MHAMKNHFCQKFPLMIHEPGSWSILAELSLRIVPRCFRSSQRKSQDYENCLHLPRLVALLKSPPPQPLHLKIEKLASSPLTKAALVHANQLRKSIIAQTHVFKTCLSIVLFIPYFRLWYFGHFSFVIFFLVFFHLALQIVNKGYIIFSYFCNFVTKSKKENEKWDERIFQKFL